MDMNQNEKRVSLFLSGDAVIHESVYMDAMREDGSFDFDRQLHSIRDLIRNYDLAYYNQETPLGGTDLTLSGYPTFNSPVEFGEYMVKSGFNLISTASNHCLDRGMEGVKRTRDLFHRYPGVLVSGTASVQEEKDTIASMEVNGIRIALVSWCERLFGNIPEAPYEVNCYAHHEEEMLDEIRRAKKTNDAVILAIHWGEEYAEEPTELQRQLAERCVKVGADLIVGNHVHVIQPFEMIDHTPVFYAMGNLISSQLNPENLLGLTAGMDLVLKEENGKRSVHAEHIRADFICTLLKGTYPDLRTDIRVIPYSKLPEPAKEEFRAVRDHFAANLQRYDDTIEIGSI